ncbi:hypothetical protein ACSFBX_34170 [Variovorax sp. RB2P76]
MIDTARMHAIPLLLSEKVFGAALSARKTSTMQLNAVDDDLHCEYSER